MLKIQQHKPYKTTAIITGKLTALKELRVTNNLLRTLPSFDNPMELLGACHDNVRRFTGQLAQLVNLQRENSFDENAKTLATQILRYFDQAAPHHHADEEENLFPALLGLNDEALNANIKRLYQEHQQMAAAWQLLRPQLIQIQNKQAADLSSASTFCKLYEEHALFEDEQIYPHAQSLQPETLQQLGLLMAERRTGPHP